MKIPIAKTPAHNSLAIKSPRKVGEKNVKQSPEYKLGLGIEKLLEQGVRVEKIDNVLNKSSETNDKSAARNGFGKAINKNICLIKAKRKRHRRRFIVINGIKQRISNLPKKESTEQEAPGKTFLKLETAKNAVDACVKDLNKNLSKDRLLDEGVPLLLQVTCIKKITASAGFVRFRLPHSFVDDLTDVCLIVQDHKASWNKMSDPDETINKVQENLRAKKVTSIKKIITFNQLKTDYGRHETRRKLCNSFDFFLADKKLHDDLFPCLGTKFYDKRKLPVFIQLDANNLNNKINKALATTAMKISADQDLFTCQIGHSKQDINHLAENIVSVGQQLDKKFPGSIKNIRFIALKSARSMTFPIYYSTTLTNKVKTPVVKPKRPKMYEAVTDELSTLGRQVKVHPDGTVELVSANGKSPGKRNRNKNKMQNKAESPNKKNGARNEDDNNEEESSDDDDDELKFYTSDENEESGDESNSQSPISGSKKKARNKLEGSDNDDSESSDDDLSRKTEEAYLQSMGQKLNDSDDDDDDEEEEKEEEEDDGDDLSDKKKGVKINIVKKKSNSKVQNSSPNVTPKAFKSSSTPGQKNSTDGKAINTSQKQNPANKKQKAKAEKRKTFDTSLGETWTVKKKFEEPSGEKSPAKKRKRSKSKANKSQRKGNLKMKKAKQNKN